MIDFDGQIPRERDAVSGVDIGARCDTTPARRPERVVLDGRYVRLEPLDPARHGDDLFAASTVPDAHARFLFLGEEPPTSRADFDTWLKDKAGSADPMYWAIIDKASGRALGRQTLMRIDPANRAIEIGNIYWGPDMAGTRMATEAQYLFMRHAFDDLGYRRYEWKCNALNFPSRRAALRFGFTYEGHFRRNVVVKGRIRDTTWFSIVDEEWPAIKAGYESWLAPGNFDANGQQRATLGSLLPRDRANWPTAL